MIRPAKEGGKKEYFCNKEKREQKWEGTETRRATVIKRGKLDWPGGEKKKKEKKEIEGRQGQRGGRGTLNELPSEKKVSVLWSRGRGSKGKRRTVKDETRNLGEKKFGKPRSAAGGGGGKWKGIFSVKEARGPFVREGGGGVKRKKQKKDDKGKSLHVQKGRVRKKQRNSKSLANNQKDAVIIKGGMWAQKKVGGHKREGKRPWKETRRKKKHLNAPKQKGKELVKRDGGRRKKKKISKEGKKNTWRGGVNRPSRERILKGGDVH